MIRTYQEQLVEVENGEALFRVSVFFDADADVANLPTSGIANGSFAFNTKSGLLKAFSEADSAWNDICTIGE